MISAAIAWVFVGFTIADWWAVIVTGRVMWRNRQVRALGDQFIRFLSTAIGATCFGFLGAAYLIGASVRLTGPAAILLLVACALTCWPPVQFLATFYLRRG